MKKKLGTLPSGLNFVCFSGWQKMFQKQKTGKLTENIRKHNESAHPTQHVTTLLSQPSQRPW